MVPKTILHMIETGGPGGAENVLINLAVNLDKNRFSSIVVLRRKGWLFGELLSHGVETHLIEEKGLFDIFFLTKLCRLIIKRKITHIHAHEFLMSLYAAIAGMLCARRTVCTFHGKFYYWEKRRRRIMMRLIAKFAQIVAVSKDLSIFLTRSVGIAPQRIKVVYNGIDFHRFQIEREKNFLGSQLNIQADDHIIGTIGNLYPVKGQTYLLQAIPMILENYPKCKFFFIGRGSLESNLRAEAKRLGICDHVFFLGFRSDIPELLDLMDVFVLPSLSECLPLSVLEAMASGVVPIVTDVGGNSEVIENNENGFIVSPGDAVAIAEKVRMLLGQREMAKKMGFSARETVLRRFSLKNMVREYERVYENKS